MAAELVCYCDEALKAMETICIPVRRLLRFARSDNRQTVIAMEHLLRQKQSAYRLGDCFASLAVTTAKPSSRWCDIGNGNNLHTG